MATTICTTAQNNYTAAKITMQNATAAYQTCSTQNPSQYSAPDQILQPVPDPVVQRTAIANTLQTQFNDQVALYTSLIASTKALIAATQPLKDYKSILTNQLNTTNQQNETLQQQITTGTNTFNQVNSNVPELSNTGPFGTANLRSGVLGSFLFFNSLFYIVLSAVLYLRYKNSISPGILYSGIAALILLGGVGGGYISYIVLSMDDNMGSFNIFMSIINYIFSTH